MKNNGLPWWVIIVLIVLGALTSLYFVSAFITGSKVTNSTIDYAKENARRSTILNFSQKLSLSYMESEAMQTKLDWFNYDTRQIDFNKLDSKKMINYDESITCKYGYIDELGEVTLEDCKFDNYETLYSYKNRTVTSNAK